MTAPNALSIHDTQPIPAANGMPAIHYRIGDQITDLREDHTGQRRRYVGTVIASGPILFDVRWTGGHGVARYAHDHEPPTLRRATAGDERAAMQHTERASIAAELRRLAQTQTTWPGEVRRHLATRAAEIVGGA